MTGYDAILHKLDEEEGSHTTFLADGKASDFAEYKRICGVIRGLRLAQDITLDLQKAQEESDE